MLTVIFFSCFIALLMLDTMPLFFILIIVFLFLPMTLVVVESGA